MTGKRSSPRHSAHRSGGGGILLLVLLLLAAGVIKYADMPWMQTARSKAAEVLAGAPGIDRALAVLGGADDEMTEVFGTQTEKSKPVYAASSGGADDIIGREDTLFPDTVDETVYPMKFSHTMPAQGERTSDFGSRLSPVTGQPGFHYGLDVAAQEGTPISAFADGTVRETGETAGYGAYLILDHADGFATLYAHCSSISVNVGDTVACGSEIARIGQTGNATGPHLHLELWKDNAALDPADYLTET